VKKSRFTEEQIAFAFERRSWAPFDWSCRNIGISAAGFYKWRYVEISLASNSDAGTRR
jgi:hypothetical protein